MRQLLVHRPISTRSARGGGDLRRKVDKIPVLISTRSARGGGDEMTKGSAALVIISTRSARGGGDEIILYQ